VVPMEDINLHFTGDFSAIEKANNLLSALVDNNLQSKTRGLGLDGRTIMWNRVMDMNDRALRNLVVGLGGKAGGVPREGGFNITAASEIMAILCLSNDIADLKRRMGNIYIGDTFERKAIYARYLNATGAMGALLKDAIKPNLVQTLEGNPAIIHGGPFANIAQGTNSVIATKMGLSLSDYVITEAGFGADLGAEKFLNIKCRAAGLSPDAVVIVTTMRALKYHGGAALKELKTEDLPALKNGLANLERHIENMRGFGLPVVVSINRFVSDTKAELDAARSACEAVGASVALGDGWEKAGDGMIELAEKVVAAAESCEGPFQPSYELTDSFEAKIEAVAKKIYRARSVIFQPKARLNLKRIKRLGLEDLPICVAKTQNSFSDDAKALGAPKDFDLVVREIEIAAGAEFLIPI
ncbi:MAG: formate--tetrahydrofolate ligase, partial [Methylococcales bacterium]|nr:formate--tetrahydrofolate ligase [Methylococcales bacterium]